LTDGYWLTKDADTWRDRQDNCQIDAKRILAETHRHKRELAGRSQRLLFTV